MNILISQRRSRAANNTFSLSVEARILEMMDYLQKNGAIQYAVAYADDAHIGKILHWADAIIISRNLSEHEIALIYKAKSIGKHVVLDIDDYLFSKPSYSQQGEFSQDNIWKLQRLTAFIDHIVVSNEHLRDALMEYGITTSVIKTRTNINRVPPKKQPSKVQKYVYTTTDNIKLNTFKKTFIQMLQDFHAEFRDIKMVVYSDTIYDVIRLPFVEWFPRMHYKDYISSLSRGNYLFSVIPLGGDEDNEDLLFHACKSPVKYFDYGLARIPGIYSDVPLYRSCINHRSTGLLVKNDCNEWYKNMKLLQADERMRTTIASNAYTDICQQHNIKKSAYQYYNIFNHITKGSHNLHKNMVESKSNEHDQRSV